ncbi:MAG: ATP-binding protein, partial [Chloroflexota bacterium]
LPEFQSSALEVLRQPLEDGQVTISRAAGTVTLPANFMLIAAMNPCPCGFSDDSEHDCTCTPIQVIRYRKRISGPLLDRFDIHTHVPRVEYEKLAAVDPSETSATVRARVEAARYIQHQRFAGTKLRCNADMGPAELRELCPLDSAGQSLMRNAMAKLRLSARAFHRCLKLARTIADLAAAGSIAPTHVAEALQYRPREPRL